MGRLVSWLKNHYPALVIAGAVFFSVAFASQCSFLYRWNSWNDVHCYYTVAMMMHNGSVLYRNICEHKGPYFYFLHYAASGMTPGSFLGMYFVELIYGWVFAYASYKTLKLFIPSAMRCTIGTTAILVAFYIPISFFHGDSVEEMMAPLYALSLYWLLKMVKTGNEMRWYELGLSGLFCGLAMLSKFNLMSLDEKDAFPFEIGVSTDGMPHQHVVDANTDSPFWRESKNLDAGAASTTFGDDAASNVGIMRQMFVKYSGRGKTLRITISGESESRFAIYTVDSRYRVLPNKQ